jgi:NADH dehydrogenase
VEKGALNFVIIGAGPTGTEMAGSLADMINSTMAAEYNDLAVKAARIYVIDHGHSLLGAFSPEAHEYAARILQRKGVQLRLGVLVKEVAPDHVLLSDGTAIQTRTAVWAGGLMAAPLSADAGLPRGRGGRIEVHPDFTIEGFPGVYALGDFANAPGPDGQPFPQLGSVALQSGEYVAASILTEIAGRPRTPFHYKDRGIMAMIGRNSAVAELGSKRHELDGPVAFAAWLGVHAMLMSSVRERIEAFITWGWNYFGRSRAVQVLDRSDEGRIDWSDDPQRENVSVPPAMKAAG